MKLGFEAINRIYNASTDSWDQPLPALDSDKTLVTCFGSADIVKIQRALDELRQAYPKACVLGCSTAGEIYKDHVLDESLSVGVAHFASTTMRQSTVELTDDTTSFDVGSRIARELDDQERRIYGLEVTILQDPERATLYHDLAVIHTKRGETEKARRRYIQAVLRDSNYAAAYHNLGTIQLRRGQLREAMGLYRRALRADSTYVLAYRSLGNVYMRMRQVSAAINTFESGLRLEPDNEDLLNRARIAREILAESTQ